MLDKNICKRQNARNIFSLQGTAVDSLDRYTVVKVKNLNFGCKKNQKGYQNRKEGSQKLKFLTQYIFFAQQSFFQKRVGSILLST